MFDINTFYQLNAGKNKIVKSSVKQFEGKTSASGLSIKLPISGKEHYRVANVDYEVIPGSYLVVGKGENLECRLDSKDVVDAICIYLDEAIYKEVLASKRSSTWLEIEQSVKEEIYTTTELYHLENDGLSNYLKNLVRKDNTPHLTEEDFISMAELLAQHQWNQLVLMDKIDALNFSTRKELLRRLRIAKAYINENYSQEIQLGQIAQAACLSKYHLLRCFREVYQLTPYQALLQRRIAKAKQQLLARKTVEAVAFDCGFSNRRSFSRAFKKIVGYTPSEYSLFNHQ